MSSGINNLSDDLLLEVFSYTGDLARSAGVNKEWYQISQEAKESLLRTIPYVNADQYVRRVGCPAVIHSREELKKLFQKFADQLERNQVIQMDLFFPRERVFYEIALANGNANLMDEEGPKVPLTRQKLVIVNLPPMPVCFLENEETPPDSFPQAIVSSIFIAAPQENEEIATCSNHSTKKGSIFPNSATHLYRKIQGPKRLSNVVQRVVHEDLLPLAKKRLAEMNGNRLKWISAGFFLGTAIAFMASRGSTPSR